ncbi:MAG: hypothetical protein SFV17_05780 [Candidatus Obscuribacter sp.]|nr:hypothetical protein [Candidatus Obscuribacter sp.]
MNRRLEISAFCLMLLYLCPGISANSAEELTLKDKAERAYKSDELATLAKSSDIEVRARVAENLNTPEAVLLSLAGSMKLSTYAENDDRDVFFALLKNPSLPASVFSVLAKKALLDWDFTDHPRAPLTFILQRLIRDDLYKKGEPDYEEFQTLVSMQGKASDGQILDFMSRAKNFSLVKIAARNAATLPASLRALYLRSKADRSVGEGIGESIGESIKEYLAENPALPEDIMEALSHEKDNDIRAHLAENANCPNAVLERLAKEEERYVAEKAMKTYYYKNGGVLLRP